MTTAEDMPGLLARTSFIGRIGELEALNALVSDPVSDSRLVLIDGEPGIGKTRLVEEFLRNARCAGLKVARGGCYPVAEAGPYLPILQILHQLRRSDDTLERQQDMQDEAMLPLNVQKRRARFVREVADDVVREAGDGTTVICVEDLHWADVGSLLVLNDLLDIGHASLVIVGTARLREAMEPSLRQLLNRIAQRSSTVELSALSVDELAQLVAPFASSQRLSPAEVKTLWRFSGGNPLFVTELMRHLQDSGLLQHCRMGEAIDRLRIPSDLTDLLDLRLARLREPVLAAMSAAAVIGSQPSLSSIAELLDAPEQETRERLDEAAEHDVIALSGLIEDPTIRFTHPLFERRLYYRLKPRSRRLYHRRAAAAAEAGRIAMGVEDLARHYALGLGRASGRTGVARCREAAKRAEELLSYESASRFWEMALACSRPKQPDERADLYMRLGRALWAAGKWPEAAAAWEHSVERFEALGDLEHAAVVAGAIGDVLRWRSELDGAQRWLERALALGLQTTPHRGRALAILGSIYRFRGDERADAALAEAELLAVRQHPDPRAMYWISYAHLIGGNRSRAEETGRAGLEEAQRQDDANATALLATSLFNHELADLRIDEAARFAAIARNAASESDPASMIRALLCSALLWGYRGKWSEVLSVCEEWMAKARLASRFQVATASLFWAEARFTLGDTVNAVQALRDALPDLAEMHPVAALHLARMLVRSNQREEAVRLVAQYEPLVLHNPRATVAAARTVLGDVAASLDDPDLSQRCYSVLAQEDRALVAAYAPVSVKRVLGKLASELKRWPEAIEHFETAAKTLSEGGARWELASALLDYAEMRRRRGRRGDAGKAAALELQADAIYAELGVERPWYRPGTSTASAGNRFDLTSRELEVLGLVAQGLRNQEIAGCLVISQGTVNRHLENIYAKMGAKNRTEAVLSAAREGLFGSAHDRMVSR